MGYNYHVSTSVQEFCKEQWPEVQVSRIWLREKIYERSDLDGLDTAEVQFNDLSRVTLELSSDGYVVGIARTFG